MISMHNRKIKVIFLSLAASVSLISSGFTGSGVMALAGKKPSLKLPVNDKLDLEASPEPVKAEEQSADLAPLTLNSPLEKKADATTTQEDGSETLNATVTKDQFVPKGPLEGDNDTLKSTFSVKNSKMTGDGSGKGSLVDQATMINASPLTLQPTTDEQASKLTEEQQIEKEQMTALWEAALQNSPDINFVLSKLMPSSDPSKTVTLLMKTLSTVIYTGIGSMGMMNPTQGTYLMQNLSFNVFSQILGTAESARAKKANISQAEQIMLYNMIRNTADKVVGHYRDYKLQHKKLNNANEDFEDLKRMVSEASAAGSSSQQIEMQYTLKKAQREINEIGGQLGKYRQHLVDLSGQIAVEKLDESIDKEFSKTQLAGSEGNVEAEKKTDDQPALKKPQVADDLKTQQQL
ncbi:MAG: hypothetical protein SFY67_13310 [Candidatus Melainabacteria bacterium]|nr:hypothetical protein [Candidatus Melainabacteria bacterium]